MIRIKQFALGALVALSLANGGLLIGMSIEAQVRLASSQESSTQALPAWTGRGQWSAPMGANDALGPIAGSNGKNTYGRESS